MSCTAMARSLSIFIFSSFITHHFLALSLHLSPDIAVLQSFKNSCTSDLTGFLSSWDESTDPCNATWQGVVCRHDRVNRLILEGLSLDCRVDLLAPLPFLSVLSLKNNNLNGTLNGLDLAMWQPHLKLLYLSNNQFSGPFPHPILSLRHLRRLDLAGNQFSGTIPHEIGDFLPSIFTLRLENNLFSGEIPVSISTLAQLSELNLSYNHIGGRIPRRLASFPLSSFIGNLALCGDPLRHHCGDNIINSNPAQISKKEPRKWVKLVIILAASFVGVVTFVLGIMFALCLTKKEKTRETFGDQGDVGAQKENKVGEMIVFCEGREEFSMEELMRGSAEMLGRGVVGTTYRVVMEGKGDENGVAVKRVRRERRREDDVIIEKRVLGEMGGWKHPNVAMLRAYYSSADELLLVFDFLSNGSLYDLLHGNRGPGRIPIDWHTRLKLAEDAARGLVYLHGISKSNLTHQHLTSFNILVNPQGSAIISDFSLLRLISNPPSAKDSSQMDDVYSFGVILLEILTGRSTEDGKLDLAKWVQTILKEEWTSEVFDVELWGYKEIEDEMMALLQVALLCVGREAKDRPKMAVVYKMIEDIRDRGSRSRSRSSQSRSPSLTFESSPCLSEDTPTLTSS